VKTCDYSPTQGIYKGSRCLLAEDHDGAHNYDPAKVPPAPPIATAVDDELSEQEIMDAISEEEIRRRSERLDEAQGIWERAHARAMPKMPCPECSANGAVVGGSLGDHCPTCHGTRVVSDDSVEFEFTIPPFAELRAAVSAYGDALVWRRNGLPSGLPAKRLAEFKKKMVLPPASSVPSLEHIEDLLRQGRAKHAELAGHAAPMLPPAKPPRRTGFEREGGIEDTDSDADLDDLEREQD
jgi:hypothetical protein